MGKLIAILTVILLSVSAYAQEPQLDVDGNLKEVKALQEQLASVIKARGEDQKVLSIMKGQMQALLDRLPAKTAKEASNEASRYLDKTCRTVNKDLDVVSFDTTGKITGFTCK